jgi:hypothetical protein
LGLLDNNDEVSGMKTYTKFTRFEIVAHYRPDQYTMEDIRDYFIEKVLQANFDITIEELDTWEVKQ